MSPHTKRSAILPNASSFFPPPPTLFSFPSPLSLHLQLFNAPAAAPPLLLSIPPLPAAAPAWARRREKSQTRRAAFGGAAAPARPWRGAAAPLGRLASFGRRARASGGGLAQGGKRGQNAPSFPHSGKNPPQNIAICAPVCYTMHATQFHR